MKASYPLQLSVRVDESRKYLIFDSFEFKPSCSDVDDPDLSKYFPTGRGFNRFLQAYQNDNIDLEDDDYEDDDDQSYYTDQMELNDASSMDRDTQRLNLIFMGVAGNFAYSRCLRFRFRFNNIVGISLQKSSSGTTKGGSKDLGAVLVLDLSRPPPDDAFAVRKIQSRWNRENEFLLIKDWTPKSAASKATRIYLYGGLDELKQTVALMAKKSPLIAAMLASTSSEENNNNSLFGDEASIEHSASPDFSIPETVTYGGRNPSRTLADVDPDERITLRNCYRTAFCKRCGTVWFRGNTGFPCTGCGDGRWTVNLEPTTESAFNGQIENAMSVVGAKRVRQGPPK